MLYVNLQVDKIPPITTEDLFTGGRLPLKTLMDDEEEDMLSQRPISQCWGTPFRNLKMADPADSQDLSTQTSNGPNALENRSDRNNFMGSNNNTIPCGSHGDQTSTPFHHNAGLRRHFPAEFEPLDDRGQGRSEEEQGGREDDQEEERRRRVEERPEEQQEEDSVEARIGRKLRKIGDQFHEDHVQLFLQHQRNVLPVWMRLTIALYGFLFNRGAPAVPRLRGQER
ncbi:hypothetical protein UPYG_G00247560 [Umbra pygmaea]|uniref:Uncharacterized protein n=1 Tax=Umbra pygmaea TaxID=75934 RepID=A0ABD0W8H0_UMBPY